MEWDLFFPITMGFCGGDARLSTALPTTQLRMGGADSTEGDGGKSGSRWEPLLSLPEKDGERGRWEEREEWGHEHTPIFCWLETPKFHLLAIKLRNSWDNLTLAAFLESSPSQSVWAFPPFFLFLFSPFPSIFIPFSFLSFFSLPSLSSCVCVNLILSSFFTLFKILCLCSISQDSSRGWPVAAASDWPPWLSYERIRKKICSFSEEILATFQFIVGILLWDCSTHIT